MTKINNLEFNSYRICGLDEAGRGALVGPLVAAAVILPVSSNIISRMAKTKIKDGKFLTRRKRIKIYQTLKKLKTEIYLEIISARQINNRGISWSNREIFRRLIRKISADKFIVDGNLKIGSIQHKTGRIKSQIDADATVPAVILAGIVAKVKRDILLRRLHRQFPCYHWHNNFGYGTPEHVNALVKYQACRQHRSVFLNTLFRGCFKTWCSKEKQPHKSL